MGHHEKVEPTLFSYVVDHDVGFAPNTEGNFCTLVHRKFGGTSGRRNIVELADVGDWVVGTGGRGKRSAGNGKLIYLMRVDEKLPFRKFLSDRRFKNRRDCTDLGSGNAFALVSSLYIYFGKNALPISTLPDRLAANLEKRGPWFRTDYPKHKIRQLKEWFIKNYEIGVHGDPCGSSDNSIHPRPHIRSKCSLASAKPEIVVSVRAR
jgi:hypothetical protein